MPNLGAGSTGMAKDANWRNNFEIPLARSRSDSRFLRSKKEVMFRLFCDGINPLIIVFVQITTHPTSSVLPGPLGMPQQRGSYSPKLRSQ